MRQAFIVAFISALTQLAIPQVKQELPVVVKVTREFTALNATCPADDGKHGYCTGRYPFDVAVEQHSTYGVLRWHGAEATFTAPPIKIEQDGGTLLVTYRMRPTENNTLTPEFP